MSKKRWIGILSICFSIALFVSLLWGYGERQQKQVLYNQLEYQYQRAFYNYVGNLENLKLLTGKARLSGNLQSAILLGEIQAEASAAATNLAVLPMKDDLSRSLVYYNQLSDYALSLSNSLSRGESISANDRATLADVYHQLQGIYDNTMQLQEAVAVGGAKFVNLKSWTSSIWPTAQAQTTTGIGSGFADINRTINGYQQLDYEGKYASSMLTMTAKGLANYDKISAKEAESAANQYLKLCGLENYEIISAGEAASAQIPVYTFACGDSNNSINLAVSESGGKLVSLFGEISGSGKQQNMDVKSAEAYAGSLLKDLGYTDMVLSSVQTNDRQAVMKFVRKADDTTYYPDSINVRVDLDKGLISGFDASQYWLNCCERDFSGKEMYDQQAAIGGLGKDFTVSGSSLAVISDGAGSENLCYEIRGKYDGEEYWDYINTDGGKDECLLLNSVSGDSYYQR